MTVPVISVILLGVGLIIAIVGFGYSVTSVVGIINVKNEIQAFVIGMLVMVIGGALFAVGAMTGGWSVLQQFIK